MNSNQELIQNQRLALKLSPQMIQSINLLTLPIFELRERMLEEAETNPALEITEDSALTASIDDYAKANSDFNFKEKNSDNISSKSDSFLNFLENQPANEETLQEHLLFQLAEIKLPQDEELLAESIIQNLDGHGFHFVPPESLYAELLGAETLDEGQKKHLEKVLNIVRNFDPVGTAFDNARQSLVFQAQKRNAPALVLELLKNHFEKLANMRVSAVQKLFPDSTAAEIENAFAFIKTLEPYPAQKFGSANIQFIAPDVYVYKVDTDSQDIDDRFAVVCEEKSLPELRLSPLFLDLSKKDAKSSETAFVNEQLKEAEWFLNGLSRRNQTLVKVTKEIIRRQKAFFLGFSTAPAALKMNEVAEALNIHEATVSRITAGKYLQCCYGTFPLRYFFTNAAVSSVKKNSAQISNENSGKTFSKEEIKQRILVILKEAEKNGRKVSDEKISKMLTEYGMTVARRTVSKYRAELNIASSYDR